jgi:F-type H+-transporting ATPase subunit epsilon
MQNTFYLEIISVDRQFYIGPAEALLVTIQDGQYEVLPGHEDTVVAVLPCELKYQVNGQWLSAAVSGGFAEITADYVIVLVASAEHPEEINVKRAEAARERAEERLRHKQSVVEYYQSKAALARAMARLKTRGRRK